MLTSAQLYSYANLAISSMRFSLGQSLLVLGKFSDFKKKQTNADGKFDESRRIDKSPIILVGFECNM